MSVKRVGRDAMVYGFGVVMQRVASFILLPVYTRLLTPADYGLLELLELTVEVASILVSAGTMAGVQRFYFKRETEKERQEIISSVLVLLGALNAIAAIGISVFAVPIHRYALGGAGDVSFLYLVSARMMLETATIVPFAYMRVLRVPKKFVTASVTVLMLKLSLNILFVVVLRMGVLGVLLSGLIATGISGLFLLVWLFRKIRFRVSREAMSDLRRFGVPYQFAQAGGFVLTFGDRFFLQGLQGMTSVGIYSLAYKFGFVTNSLAVGPLLQAWEPYRFETANLPREERDFEYNRGFKLFSLIMIPVSVGIATGARPLIRVMSDPQFLPAASLVPIIVLAYVIQGWTAIVRFGIATSERTVYHAIAVWSSVIIILAAYATLIPRYGALGAAISTVIGFTVRFASTLFFAQRLWPVSLKWGPHLALMAVATSIVLGYMRLPASIPILWDMGAAASAFAATGLTAFFVLLSAPERTQTISLFRDRVNKYRSSSSH